MWKIIILSAFLSVSQAANIDEIYGTYTGVVVYLNTSSPNLCVQVSLSEDPRKIECTCSDGTKSTLAIMTTLEELSPKNVRNRPARALPVPVQAVDKLDENAPFENATCNCAGQTFDYRAVIQVLNENYIISCARTGSGSSNHDLLAARILPSAAELETSLRKIDALKNRTNGSVLCTKEIYEELRANN